MKFAIYDCLYELNEGIDPNKNDDIDVQVLIDIICNISNLNIEEIAEKTECTRERDY